MSMKHILIPTDFSTNSWKALEFTIGLFKNEACTFYILHIGDLKESPVRSNSFIMPTEELSVSIKEKLNALFERLKKLPVGSKHHFISLQDYGNFLSSIKKTVEARNIELIALGTKGASGIKASIVGTNTGDVITKVPCNVLVVPEGAVITIPEKIVFPTDYNIFYSHKILKVISEILLITAAKLHVLNVLKNSLLLTEEQEKNKVYLQHYLEETFQDSHRFYDVVNKNVRTAIQHHVVIGNADMVIMVAKNLNFLQSLLFDSTIEKLSFHTTVPLLVLHE